MDIKIGVTYSPREVTLDLDDSTDVAALKADIDQVLSTEGAVFWVTDEKGRQVGVPGEKIAYVELGTADAQKPIGFGG